MKRNYSKIDCVDCPTPKTCQIQYIVCPYEPKGINSDLKRRHNFREEMTG